jgi:hypothetical protein
MKNTRNKIHEQGRGWGGVIGAEGERNREKGDITKP